MKDLKPTFNYSSFRSHRLSKIVWYIMPKFLLHLLACSMAKISGLEIVRSVVKGNYGYITKIFQKIIALINLGFDQNRAYELAASKISISYLKEFILRFAQAMRIGEEAETFFTREYMAFISTFKSNFDRTIVTLHRLSEAHSAMLSSSVLIMAIMVFASMIWGLSQQSIMGTVLAVVGIQFTMAYVFYALSPREHVISHDARPEKLSILMRLSRMTTIILLVVSLTAISINILGVLNMMLTSIAVIGISSLAALIGWLGNKWIVKVKSYDRRFPEFISTVAAGLSSLGSSLKRAMDDLIKIDFGPLNSIIKRMKARLDVDVNEDLCWKLFQSETGSDLIVSHTTIFNEAIKLGAPISKVGESVSNSAITLLDARRKIEEISAFLKGIMLPLQPALYAIMGLVLVIINSFSEVVSSFSQMKLPMVIINAPNGEHLQGVFLMVLTAISIANALILHFANGQTPFIFTYYIGLFLAAGWVAFFATYNFVGGALKSIGLQSIIVGGG